MDSAQFLIDYQDKVDSGGLDNAMRSIEDPKNVDYIMEYGWELVTCLCNQLKEEKILNEEFVQFCFKCLNRVVEICKPKEILLAFNEKFRNIKSPKVLSDALEVTLKAFLKIERKQSLHLKDILETFGFAIKNIVSDTLENNNEHFLHVYEQISKSIEQFLSGFVDLIGMRYLRDLTDFYAGRCLASSEAWCRYEVKQCRRTILQFVFDFVELLSSDGVTIDDIHGIKEPLIGLLEVLHKLVSVFEELSDLSSKDINNAKDKQCGKLVLLYLELHNGKHFPKVLSPEVVRSVIHGIVGITFERNSNLIIKLSLNLHDISLKLLKKESLNNDEFEIGKDISMGLTKVMVWCDQKDMRDASKRQFDILLTKFTLATRYSILRHLYDKSDHSSLRGYIIDVINNIFKKDAEETIPKSEIKRLSIHFLSFEQGENVLQESERLNASLNFIRFWMLRDPKHVNKTGIWDNLEEITNKCKHIRNGVEVSIGEYHKFLQGGMKNGGVELELTIPGMEVLGNLQLDEKRMMVQRACLTMEMMLSVIIRILEISDT